MSEIKVIPVLTKQERKIFLHFPWEIYRGDPLWVPPLLPDRTKTIDPRRGTFFLRGEAEFFIAWQDGKPVGTICAAEDKAVNEQRNKRDCMFGFFDCIDDYRVAEALFQQAANWAKKRGLETLYGPFNLDYEDGYGILIEGRERPPAILCGHTPPYYQVFVERYGFQPARGDNLAYCVDISPKLPGLERLQRLAERIEQRGRVTIRGADLKHWREEADRVWRLINIATAHLPDFIPWQRDVMHSMLDSFRHIADPDLVLFAEVNGETVGWFPAIPDLNEIFIKANGLRYPWDTFRLWPLLPIWGQARRKTTGLAIKSVLVMPEYWDTGVSVLLFNEMAKRAIAKGYTWVDLSLTSSDNPDTPVLAERMGARIYKRYRVYRLWL